AAGRRAGIMTGRGLACVVYEGDNGYVAMVAEVDVDRATGKVTAKRFVVAQDCGPISNPDGMRNQIEGGALQGLSRALGEEVTWDDHAVTSIDWRTYHSLPLGVAMPAIESVLIDTHGVEAMGAGETAKTVVPDLDRRIAQFKPVRMPFDGSGLTDRERQEIDQLVAASRALESMYWRQSDPAGLALYKALASNDAPAAASVRHYLFINGS